MKIFGKDESEKGKAWRKKREENKKERIERRRKARSLGPGLIITRFECPKCGAKLYQSVPTRFGTGFSNVIYHCKKCGYSGQIGLEPEESK